MDLTPLNTQICRNPKCWSCIKNAKTSVAISIMHGLSILLGFSSNSSDAICPNNIIDILVLIIEKSIPSNVSMEKVKI
jgi:hypothetical protein